MKLTYCFYVFFTLIFYVKFDLCFFVFFTLIPGVKLVLCFFVFFTLIFCVKFGLCFFVFFLIFFYNFHKFVKFTLCFLKTQKSKTQNTIITSYGSFYDQSYHISYNFGCSIKKFKFCDYFLFYLKSFLRVLSSCIVYYLFTRIYVRIDKILFTLYVRIATPFKISVNYLYG